MAGHFGPGALLRHALRTGDEVPAGAGFLWRGHAHRLWGRRRRRCRRFHRGGGRRRHFLHCGLARLGTGGSSRFCSGSRFGGATHIRRRRRRRGWRSSRCRHGRGACGSRRTGRSATALRDGSRRRNRSRGSRPGDFLAPVPMSPPARGSHQQCDAKAKHPDPAPVADACTRRRGRRLQRLAIGGGMPGWNRGVWRSCHGRGQQRRITRGCGHHLRPSLCDLAATALAELGRVAVLGIAAAAKHGHGWRPFR